MDTFDLKPMLETHHARLADDVMKDYQKAAGEIASVTWRLKSEHFGEAEKINVTVRRAVYGFVDRKMRPSLYRSFDFPDPNFSAPKRSRTALTPRALILMNSPLLT